MKLILIAVVCGLGLAGFVYFAVVNKNDEVKVEKPKTETARSPEMQSKIVEPQEKKVQKTSGLVKVNLIAKFK